MVGSILVHEGERLEMFCWKRALDESGENLCNLQTKQARRDI